MQPPVPVLQSAEQQLARVYDQQYRLRLTRQVARVLLFLLVFLFVGAALPATIQHQLAAHLPQIGMFAALEVAFGGGLFIGYRLAQRERATAAVNVVIITTIIGACSFAIVANFLMVAIKINSVIGFLALIVGIIVAGLLGSLAWTLATTFFMNVFTVVALLWVLPHIAPATASLNPLPVLVIEISVQWLCAALLSYNQFYFRQTIRALSAAQISAEQAQQLDDLKDQFIRSVNHELRNPIMAMMNYVTILRQRNADMAPDRRATYLTSLDETGKRIIQLIGSILDTRQIEQRPEDFVPARVPVKETLLAASRLLDPAEARMAERDLFVTIPDDLTIWGNEVYLQQIFTNLLSNAVKYSAPGTAIEVRMYPLAAERKAQGAPIEIMVRDHGLGIPAAQVPLLFHRFARLPRDLTSSTSGNGLGLYLCKVLTEAMGGQIWVESSGIEGEGSTFHIVLPTEAVAAPAETAQPAPALVMGRWPVRQARIALAGAVALVLVVGLAVALAQPPGMGPTIVGELHFVDVSGGSSNGVTLQVTGLPAPPGGSHYQAWIIDTTNESIIDLGNVMAQNNEFDLDQANNGSNSNLLTTGNEIEVTLERQQTTAPTGQIVFKGFYPQKAMVHVRHLLVSFPTTPNHEGLLVGLLHQTQVLSQQSLLLSTSTDATRSHCIILSQLNVLEGNAVAPAIPASCAKYAIPQGDGLGLLAASPTTEGGYIALASGHASLALQQPDATPSLREHGSRAIDALSSFKNQAQSLDAQLRQLAKKFDASQIAGLNASVQSLLGTQQPPAGGPPPDAPNGGAPPPAPGNAYAAYGEGQRMTNFTFTYHPASH